MKLQQYIVNIWYIALYANHNPYIFRTEGCATRSCIAWSIHRKKCLNSSMTFLVFLIYIQAFKVIEIEPSKSPGWSRCETCHTFLVWPYISNKSHHRERTYSVTRLSQVPLDWRSSRFLTVVSAIFWRASSVKKAWWPLASKTFSFRGAKIMAKP
jgi:hypothetical protein